MKNLTTLLKSKIVFLFIVLIMVGCSKINQNNFEKIELGMTKNKVEEIFGKSNDGKYLNLTKSTEVTFEYDEDIVIFKTYITKKSSEESILVADFSLEGVYGLPGSRGRSVKQDTTIRNYKICVSSATRYIDPDNDNKPFPLNFSSLYKILGNYKSPGSSIYKGEILVTQVEKVFTTEELHPKDAATFASRGNKKFQYKDYKGAISDFSEAIKLDTEDTILYVNRSISKFKSRDKIGAKMDLLKAIELGSVEAQEILNEYFK